MKSHKGDQHVTFLAHKNSSKIKALIFCACVFICYRFLGPIRTRPYICLHRKQINRCVNHKLSLVRTDNITGTNSRPGQTNIKGSDSLWGTLLSDKVVKKTLFCYLKINHGTSNRTPRNWAWNCSKNRPCKWAFRSIPSGGQEQLHIGWSWFNPSKHNNCNISKLSYEF